MHDCGVPKTFSIFGESGAYPSTYYQNVLFGTRTRVVSAKGVRCTHGLNKVLCTGDPANFNLCG